MTMKRFSISAIGTCLVGSLFLAGCSSQEDAMSSAESASNQTELRSVTLAHDGTAAAAAISLGIEQGFFEDAGLEVRHEGLGTPPAIIAAVQSDQVTAGSVPTVPLITAIDQGIPISAFAPDSGYPLEGMETAEYDTVGIYVNPQENIQRPKDLEGQKVAVPSRKAVFEVLVADSIRNDGGDPNKVEWVVLDFGSQVSALSEGQVAAAGLPMPFTVEAANAGAELLNQPGVDFYEQGPTNVWVAGPAAVEDDVLISDLQSAIQKSHEYANEHREESMERAAELTGIDLEVIQESPGFNYFPPVLEANDIERTHDKLLDLGFLETEVELSDSLLEP